MNLDSPAGSRRRRIVPQCCGYPEHALRETLQLRGICGVAAGDADSRLRNIAVADEAAQQARERGVQPAVSQRERSARTDDLSMPAGPVVGHGERPVNGCGAPAGSALTVPDYGGEGYAG